MVPDAPDATDKPHAAPEQWDKMQLAVIEAAADARLLVDAGPGTGKTAVACRRVAALIDDQGLEPGNIWLISFTRTAVKEIRHRIRHYLQDTDAGYSIKIATIDAHSWAIHSGFAPGASLTGSYEDNIERTTDLVRKHEGVFEYLQGVQHLVVDEAQDIVGQRADLVLEIIRCLAQKCGVTVFSDEAQAIYGFADEDGASFKPQGHLPERLRSLTEHPYQQLQLSEIYRTNKKGLRKLFTEVRQKVLSSDGASTGHLEDVTQLVRELADGKIAEVNGNAHEGTFVLFRRRVDALFAASYWELQPHRIRMSGLPTLLEPWLGVLFWDFVEKRLTKARFEELWEKRVSGQRITNLDTPAAWDLLMRLGGESASVVSMHAISSRLGRGAPPSEFIRPDFGLGGPIFGTIHGCKGREAEKVLLMLPLFHSKDVDESEEARVVFVGATRARAELRVGRGFKFPAARRLDRSGRSYVLRTQSGKAAAQVEVGRDEDLSIEGVAGKKLFHDSPRIVAAHNWLVEHASTITSATGVTEPFLGYRSRIRSAEFDPTVAFLSERFNADLFDIGREVQGALSWSSKLRPGDTLRHLRIFGARTFVAHPDSPERSLLHEPWAISGFALGPVVQGFDMVYFNRYGG